MDKNKRLLISANGLSAKIGAIPLIIFWIFLFWLFFNSGFIINLFFGIFTGIHVILFFIFNIITVDKSFVYYKKPFGKEKKIDINEVDGVYPIIGYWAYLKVKKSKKIKVEYLLFARRFSHTLSDSFKDPKYTIWENIKSRII